MDGPYANFSLTFFFFFRSTKNFQKKYGLTLTAATFLIIDYSEASMEIACEWQKCIGMVLFSFENMDIKFCL